MGGVGRGDRLVWLAMGEDIKPRDRNGNCGGAYMVSASCGPKREPPYSSPPRGLRRGEQRVRRRSHSPGARSGPHVHSHIMFRWRSIKRIGDATVTHQSCGGRCSVAVGIEILSACRWKENKTCDVVSKPVKPESAEKLMEVGLARSDEATMSFEQIN